MPILINRPIRRRHGSCRAGIWQNPRWVPEIEVGIRVTRAVNFGGDSVFKWVGGESESGLGLGLELRLGLGGVE